MNRIFARSYSLFKSKPCCEIKKFDREVKRIKRPKPYPYKTKSYGLIKSFFDKTSRRMNANSKIICVEGPIAVGKTELAKEIAAEMGMLYMPEASMDQFYINPYGWDMRRLDKIMPDEIKSFDIQNFCEDPRHINTGAFQLRMYIIRLEQYIDALAHLFSTGQGVVLDRSVYSDKVFLESMFECTYISKGVREVYYAIRKNTLPELLRPHLIIYLDIPLAKVQENIKKRNIDYEVQSKAFTERYLRSIDHFYKHCFLKKIEKHTPILVYDWSEGGDTEILLDDVEAVDYPGFEETPYNKKMEDWRFNTESDWTEQRLKFCNDKNIILQYVNIPRFDVPELLMDYATAKYLKDVWYSAPGMEYAKGYNKKYGDKNILFKNK